MAKKRHHRAGAVRAGLAALPACRWREIRSDGTLACHSEQFITPPNDVLADYCRVCTYANGEAPYPEGAPAPTAMPSPRRTPTAPLDPKPDPIRPVRIVRLNLPGHLNPGIIEFNGDTLLASRFGGRNAQIHLSRLDGNFQPIWTRRLRLEHPEAFPAVEDPRLFVLQGKLHVAVTGYERVRGGKVSSQLLARLSDDLYVDTVWIPDYACRLAWEKNWAFFEHSGDLFSVYSISPNHAILRHDEDMNAHLHAMTPAPINWPGYSLRGGAAPVRLGDEYYHWFHTHRIIDGKKQYAIGVYTFDARPPFTIRRHIPALVMSALRENSHQCPWTDTTDQRHAVLYPCGALLRNGEWIVSTGYRDREAWLVCFDADEIERKLAAGRLMTNPIRRPLGTQTLTTASPAEITVSTLYTPEILGYGSHAADALKKYALRHGYWTEIARSSLDHSRPASWSKIPLTLRHFEEHPECKWFFWCDADAVITRPDISLSTLIDDRFDFIVGSDPNMTWFNMGVWFARNCPSVKEFLRRAWAKIAFINHSWWEQVATQEVVRDGVPGLRYKVVPRVMFNSFAREFKEGDFILHFAGCSHSDRVRGIRERVQKLWWPEHYQNIEIPGWFDYELLYDQAIEAAGDGATLVEIGSWMGRSAAYMAQRIKDSGRHLRFFAVDPWVWTGDDAHPYAKKCYAKFGGRPMREIFDENLRLCGLADFVKPMQLPSTQAARRFRNASIDFAFIDGDHSYESVRNDIAAWLPKIKPGGMLAGHDLTMESVAKAVREAFGQQFVAENFTTGKKCWIARKEAK